MTDEQFRNFCNLGIWAFYHLYLLGHAWIQEICVEIDVISLRETLREGDQLSEELRSLNVHKICFVRRKNQCLLEDEP